MTAKMKIDKAFLIDALEEYMLGLLHEIRNDQRGYPTLNLPAPEPERPAEEPSTCIVLTEVSAESNNHWTPSAGTWFVAGNGEVRKMDPHKTPQWWKNDMEQALGSGRLYETEEHAKMAAKLQRKFMRFVKWVTETSPEAVYKNFIVANSFFADINKALEIERTISQD
jgi:hypothetical protein